MKKALITTLLASILVMEATPITAFAEWKQNSNNQWYFVDSRNLKVTSWQQIDGQYYYFDDNGILKTGWIQYGDKWYYTDGTGAMQTGWVKQGKAWYHFDYAGVMDTDTVVDGYYLGEDGIMQEKNKILFDNKYAKVTYLGVNRESVNGPKIKVLIENKSDERICIQTKEKVLVDDTKVNANFSEEIEPNSTITANLILPNNIDKNFKTINGDFEVIEKSSLNTLEVDNFSMNC